MTISLKHAFQSAKTDGADTSQVQPSNWNAEHTLTMATGSILGRSTAGTGTVEEISVGSGLSLSAGTLTATGTGTGDVTGPASSTDGGLVRFNGTTGKVIKADSTGIVTAEIASSAVTYAKIQNVSATSRLLGRVTAGAGVVEELAVGSTLTFASSQLRTVAMTGDVTASANSFATTIAAGVVTYAKMATAAIATAAEYRAATASKILAADIAWSAADLVSLTDGVTVAVDMSSGINFTVTLGGNRTLGAPTNTKTGQSGVIYVVQDGTGSRTLAYNSVYKFAGGTAPTLSTAASTVDRLTYFIRSSTHIDLDISKARS